MNSPKGTDPVDLAINHPREAMRTLIIRRVHFARIKAIMNRRDAETSVCLYGTSEGDCYFVEHVVESGDPTEEGHHAPSMENTGVRWLGQLWVHEDGYPLLLPVEHETVKTLLFGPLQREE